VLVEVGMAEGAGFSVEQQALLWGMWRGGESLRGIGRSRGVSMPRVQRFLRLSGGIRPAPQRRREGHLGASEREEISRGIAAGCSGRVIAAGLHRSPSTVAREIARNGGRESYRAVTADGAAYDRAKRPKPSKLASNELLRERVSALLVADWSPQQIAARLRLAHPEDPGSRVCHETIYRDLYVPSRKVFEATMFHRLRSERAIRRPRGEVSSHGRGRIRNMVSIHDRPTEADDRQVPGHWEGDLVFGIRPSAVATLVDRATRFTMVVALPDGYKAVTVAAALIEQMGALPPGLRRSLTWDRGKEMAAHATITAALSLPVFFCDPHHPWQRGTNENTNRLLRQYLHKNADLTAFTQNDLDAVAARLNHRPRRVLGWATPIEASAALGWPESGRLRLG
jgi:IS30 family transposase